MADEQSVPRPTRARPKPPKGTPEPEYTPGTTGTTESSATPMPARSRDDAKLHGSLMRMYEGLGGAAFLFGVPRQDERLVALANALTEPKRIQNVLTGEVQIVDPRTGAEQIADAWMTAAASNPRLKATLRRFTEGGAIAEVAALHMALLLPFLPGIPGLAFFGDRSAPAPDPTAGIFNGAPVA